MVLCTKIINSSTFAQKETSNEIKYISTRKSNKFFNPPHEKRQEKLENKSTIINKIK